MDKLEHTTTGCVLPNFEEDKIILRTELQNYLFCMDEVDPINTKELVGMEANEVLSGESSKGETEFTALNNIFESKCQFGDIQPKDFNPE